MYSIDEQAAIAAAEPEPMSQGLRRSRLIPKGQHSSKIGEPAELAISQLKVEQAHFGRHAHLSQLLRLWLRVVDLAVLEALPVLQEPARP